MRLALTAALALLTVSCGDGEDAKSPAARVVNVTMVDIGYEPASIQVGRGETVRFTFTNSGKVPHDAYVGDAAAQAEHEKQMRAAESGGHGGHGGDTDAITVAAGQTGELTHTFDRTGTVEIGCHQAGHYAAGMKITVTVT